MPRIYLSPSLQPGNPTLLGVNEQTLMGIIADAMEPLLRKCGIDFTRSKPGMTLSQVIAESNAGNYDAHIAVHSNASPTAGIGTGSRMYYYPNSTSGSRLASSLASTMKPIYYDSSKVITVPGTSLAELNSVRAPSVIAEVAFHDNQQDVDWMRDNIQNIAASLVHGTANYLGVRCTSTPCTQGTIPAYNYNWTQFTYAEVCTSGSPLNIRLSPNGPIMFTLPNSTPVVVTGPGQNGYTPIRYNMRDGWASTQFLCICNGNSGEEVPPVNPNPPLDNENGCAADSGIVVTSGSSLNIRKEPSSTSTVVGTIPNGTDIQIIGESGNWYNVCVLGWVSKTYIRSAPTGVVSTAGGNLNLRSQPNTTSSILYEIPNGSCVQIMDEAGNWYHVNVDGHSGWVSKNYINTGSTPAAQIGTVTTAGGNLNMRSSASVSAPIIASVPNGTQVPILGSSGNFYQIQYNSQTGYASKDYITT